MVLLGAYAMQQLQSNDPILVRLYLHKTDWIAGAGHAIGNNTTLKELDIIHVNFVDDDEEDDHWFDELCMGLARNATIESMSLCVGNAPLDGLTPFLENNTRLHNFSVVGGLPMSVVSALSTRENDRLKRLDIDSVEPTDEVAELFFSMLNRKIFLSELKYSNNYVERRGCIALANWLKNSATNIEYLELRNIGIGFDGLDDDYRIPILGNGLVLNTSLRTLDFSENNLGSASGSMFLSEIMSSHLCKLENLHLVSTGMRDEGLIGLGNALAGNKSIRFMDISGNATITMAGWRVLTNYLRHPQSTLKEICLKDCGITNDVASEIISALADNSCLERLILHDDALSTDKVLSDILLEIFDTFSIDRTFCSNHTFHKIEIGDREKPPYYIHRYLEMNIKENKADVARQKILDHHFTRDETDINAFADMTEAVLPFVIEWIGRDRQARSLSLMHLFVRGFPTLFDVRDTQCAGSKRKFME
jgi:hypothetical protein